jgi:hypothetical protein
MKYPGLVILLPLILLTAPFTTGAAGAVMVDADQEGVALFLDDVFIGQAPQQIENITAGEHQIGATLTGHPAQTKTIFSSSDGAEPVHFVFGPNSEEYSPGKIRIRDCIGTPEMTGLLGTSVTVTSRPDGTLMAYYSGLGTGIRCAGSLDGSVWFEYPQPCLASEDEAHSSLFSIPWVFERNGGGYRMIYGSSDRDGPALFSASSQDGITFIPEGRVTLINAPDSSSSPGDQFSIPSGIRTPDGKLRMYYAAAGGDIRSAVSGDEGLSWTGEEGVRLPSATDPSVALFPDGRYGLFYVDLAAGAKGQRLMVAVSDDGLSFTPSSLGPVLESTEKGVWILDPDIFISRDGYSRLFFSMIGTPGETGIRTPVVMNVVVDIPCLIAELSETSLIE